MSRFYNFSRIGLKALFSMTTRCEVRGKENIPGEGRLLVVANHLSLVDPPLVGVILGRETAFMAKKELFLNYTGIVALLLRSLGAFSVHRGQLDREALRQAEKVLAAGQFLVMFPEGARSSNGQLGRAYSGSALVALRCDAPILPAGIAGTERIKGLFWPLSRPRITVNIGVPFRLPPVNGRVSKAQLAEHTNFIMGRIAELLPLKYRGRYGNKGN